MVRFLLKRRLVSIFSSEKTGFFSWTNLLKRFLFQEETEPVVDFNECNKVFLRKSTSYIQNLNSKCSMLSFALMGFCNLYPILVILAAAHDLLKSPDSHELSHQNATIKSSGNIVYKKKAYNRYDCNEISTGIVLIADILPGLFIKLLYSAFPYRFKYGHRIAFCVTTSALSFFLIALSFNRSRLLMFVGIGMASISTSFGEMTFLALTTLYPKRLAFFPYAVGLALTGLVSSSSYAALTVTMRPDQAILAMSFIPILMALSYLLMPSPDKFQTENETEEVNHKKRNESSSPSKAAQTLPKLETLNFCGKLGLLVPLLKYMLPLFLVFFSEYVINQGLFELMYFKDNYLLSTHSSQYRWYTVTYRIGVFISRITVLYFPITFLLIFPVLQIVNLLVLLLHTISGFIPSIEIVLMVILWEGMVGGGCYVNALNMVSNEIAREYREFSMGAVTIADTFGIALAGFVAIPIHNSICKLGFE